MKISFLKSTAASIWIVALSLFLATPGFAQFQKVFGTTGENFFNKIILDGPDFYVLGFDDGNGTITRVSASGQHVWTRRLFFPSGLTDAKIVPGSNGNLIFVGFTLPFDNSNHSILGIVSRTGSLQKLTTYDVPGHEGFTDIEYSQASATFKVLGFQNLAGPTDDEVLLDFGVNGTLNSKKIAQSPTDDGFAQELEVLPNGDVLMAGQIGTNGVILQYDAAGNFVGGVLETSPFLFEDIELINGGFLAVGRSLANGLPRLSRFDAGLFPIWERSVQGLDDVNQVVTAPNGDIYAVGTGNFGGLDRAVILKVREIAGVPVLLWARYLKNAETAYTGGTITVLPNGNIAFADGREGNANGIGMSDAFLAVTDQNLNSLCKLDAPVILDSIVTFYAGPDFVNLSTYDNPPDTDLDISWSDWKARWACGQFAPILSCGDIHVRVEPFQTGRVVSYAGIEAAGDDVTLEFNPAQGTIFPIGITTVTATATDASGGTATCSFSVTVEPMPYDSLQPPLSVSPGGNFDQVRDRFGNPYRMSELMIPETMGGTVLCNSSGYFDLYFEPGCGMDGGSAPDSDRRNVLCQLFSDLSQFIPRNPATSTARVKIWVRDISQVPNAPNPYTSGILGLASSFYVLPGGTPNIGGVADGEIWKTINSGVDSYTGVYSPLIGGSGFYHGIIAFNFVNAGIQWQTNLQNTPTSSQYDLYSVALHEAVHALGFASVISATGQSDFGAGFPGYYSRYDTYLQSPANLGSLPIVTSTGCSPMYDLQFNPLLPVSVLQPNVSNCVADFTDCVHAISFAGNVQQTVYTPNCFEIGSSLSHLEDVCRVPSEPNNQYYVMSNANGQGVSYMKRSLKADERKVLCQLGYNVMANYGNSSDMTLANYTGGDCQAPGVAGVNDGILSNGTFAYSLTVGQTSGLVISNVLQNDVGQNLTLECPGLVSGGGTVASLNATSFTYFPPPYATTALLRYVPVDGSGTRGNITYVIVRVNPVGCLADACNMVSNGGFEASTGCRGLVPPAGGAEIDCWQSLVDTPDLFTVNCPLSGGQVGVSTFSSIPPTFTHNLSPNDKFIGMIRDFHPISEAIQTGLSSPLIPGETYRISFWAKVNNNISGSASNIPAHIHFASAPTFPLAHLALFPSNTFFQLFPDIVVPNNNAWNEFKFDFVYTGPAPHSNLIIAYGVIPLPPGVLAAYFFLDDVKIIRVINATTFTPPTPVCLSAPLVNLDASVTPPGGTFTSNCGACVGNNGTNNTFNPALAGLGSHILTYTVTDANGCLTTETATIQVANGPAVTFVPPPTPLCPTDASFLLNSLATPAGGTFTGPGVVCSGSVCSFDPAIAGLGTHQITYQYTGGACPVSVSANIMVVPCVDDCEITNHCLDFDGIDDQVNVLSPLSVGTDPGTFTVACWFRDDRQSGPNDYRLFSWNGVNSRFELMTTQNGRLAFFNNNTGLVPSAINVRDNKWHHVAAVRNGTNVFIYYDGVPVVGMSPVPGSVMLPNSPASFVIGNYSGSTPASSWWQGRIDEFKVWDAPLTLAQVQDEMNCSLDPNNINLLLHFPFDQFTANGNNFGNNLAENVVNGNMDGTMLNFGLTGTLSNWVERGRDLLPRCNPDHFAWLEGNARRNLTGRSKVYDGDIFTAGFEYTPPIPPYTTPVRNPVFTRRRADGSIVWRTMINLQASGTINDFVRTDEGCYLLVGQTPDFKGENQSFIAQIDHNGVLNWINQYDFKERENLTRIIRSDNPSNPNYPYIILGIQKSQGTTNDDVLLMAIDKEANFDWVREIGNKPPIPTDDNFNFDLINYQGGYAFVGVYDRNAIQHAVLFFTDNVGLQKTQSSEYQSGVIFVDTKLAANGQDILVAGQILSGGAFIAKMDQNGAQIWAKQFPQLTVLRKLVVRPNGDIFAVGQRTQIGKYRNVILKVTDLGASASVQWQKNAELTPTTLYWPNTEVNWSPADLVWYSGKMFFYTDSRINNSNGWGNEDIGSALYDLDQTPDICPFTQEMAVSQNYALVRAQMPILSNVLATFPIPAINPLSDPLPLALDSLCSYGCECEFSNLAFHKRYPFPIWKLQVAGCDLAPVNLPSCPGQYSPIKFAGRLKCKGGCAFSGLNWTLTDPQGTQYNGSSSSPAFVIPITLSMVQSLPGGVYTIVLTGHCGGKTCSCTIRFTVPACPPPCTCTEPEFSTAVNGGFSWLQLPGCQIRMTPKYLTECDQVTWKRASFPVVNNNFTVFATTTGNQPVTLGYSTGKFMICWTVVRTLPGGAGSCTLTRCQLLEADCNLSPQFFDNMSESQNPCDNSIVQNGGFVFGAEAGGLADVGKVMGWDASGGNPEIALEAGKLDTNLVRMRGNGQYADLLYQDSLPVTVWDSLDLTLKLRPIQGLVLPETELVVRLSAHRQDALWCGDDSTCMEVMRLSIPDLDSSIWLTAGSFAIVKNIAMPYLTIHIENPFIDDDVALKSVVDIDNVCLSKYEVVSTKQPWGTNHLRIFPNPNTGTFSVKLPEPAAEGMVFRVIGLTGQTLGEQKLHQGSTLQNVYAGDLPPGLYFLQVIADGKVLGVEKFVKQ